MELDTICPGVIELGNRLLLPGLYIHTYMHANRRKSSWLADSTRVHNYSPLVKRHFAKDGLNLSGVCLFDSYESCLASDNLAEMRARRTNEG